MANLLVLDGDSADKYLKTSGAGTDGDPHIPEHKETSAVAILAAVDGIEALATAGNASLTSIDGKLPSLGQALAAASVPVILPSATITTLTPPAAITGFATAAKQPALGTAGTASTDVITVQGIASGVPQRVSATHETSAIYDGTTALTPKFAIIDAATSGDNTLVAAVTSKKIRVLSLMLVAAGTVNVRFESGAGGTALSGQMQLTAQTGFALNYSPVGWFETGSNTLLNLELSGAVSCDGLLVYVEV